MPREVRSFKEWIIRQIRPVSQPIKADQRWMNEKIPEFKYTGTSRPIDEEQVGPRNNLGIEAPYLNDSLKLYRTRIPRLRRYD